MSKILKGLNEVNPNNYDSDWDYQDAVAKSGKSRSNYRSQEDDTSDADIAYSKKMYQLSQKQKRDADHDRLATGTNEGMMPLGGTSTATDRRKAMDLLQVYYKSMGGDFWEWFNQPGNKEFFANRAGVSPDSAYEVVDSIDWGQHPQEEWSDDDEDMKEGLDNPWGDQGNFAGDKPVSLGDVSIKNIQTGDTVKYLGQSSKVVAMSKNRKYSRITITKGMGTVTQDVLTSDLQQLGQGVREEQLDELSNEKLGQYKTAAALDAGKADKEGDYKRGDKRFSGIVKATKKQFANDTKKSSIGQGINEFVVTGGPKGPKDYGQPNSSRYIGGNKFVVGTTNNYVLTATIDKWGLEWDEDDEIWFLDSPGAAHIADASEGEIELPAPQEQRYQIHDLVTDYLNERNSADLQKVAAYYGHSNDGEMATNEGTTDEKPADPFKSTYPRVNNPKILGTQNRAKSAYYPPSKPPVKKLDKPLPESLGDNLPSKSLQALMQAKQQNEKQRMAELEQWEQDFKQNTVSKFTAREPNLRQRATSTPMVAMPGEGFYDLKAKLVQLDKAIEKQGILDKMVQRLDKKGLMTPNIEAGVDTSMLIRDGAKDSYVGLNKKLDKALEYVKNRLMTNKAAYAKPKSIDEADMTRRGFLGNVGKAAGAGAVAAAGLGGASNAQAFKGTLPATRISEDEAEAQIKELRGTAYKELASMVWGAWPSILDTTFGVGTPQDKPATPEQIGKMLGYRLAEYAEEYRQKVRAVKVAAGVRDPQILNKTTAAIYVNEQDIDEAKQRLDPKCWKGYKKQGTKMKGDTRVNNCVPVSESSILTGLKKV